MNPTHQSWVTANVPRPCNGWCRMVSAAMAHKFEELTAIEGAVRFVKQDPDRPKHANVVTVQHSWCVDDSGEVVDATAEQFEAIGSLNYIPNGPLLEDGEGATQALRYAVHQWGSR